MLRIELHFLVDFIGGIYDYFGDIFWFFFLNIFDFIRKKFQNNKDKKPKNYKKNWLWCFQDIMHKYLFRNF